MVGTPETEFPLLSTCVKYILAIPASSATSEQIFSSGGLTVHSVPELDIVVRIRYQIVRPSSNDNLWWEI